MFQLNGLKNDIISGFNVFLIALPLCLGIAIASNFPPAAGIITAVIGGIIGALLGGAKLSIKGPAAGLIAITLASVDQLGGGDLQLGYERTLAVGVVAAIIQILIAWMRKAVIAEIIPSSVIHGMLAAIGVIIVSKQSYVIMGLSPEGTGPIPQLLNLPFAIPHFNPIIFALGLLAIIIVKFWPYIKKFLFIPETLAILFIIIPLSLWLNLNVEHSYSLFGNTYTVGSSLLIKLPLQFFDAIRFPDFSGIFSLLSIKYIIMFALVGSIESSLTVRAVDAIAKPSLPSNLNKDLFAVGVGNLLSACIGGLPMISEIVRSKANIDFGAKTAKSNFFHGIFLLIAVLLLPTVMNLIPLSALAALLILVGIKLASPREFIHSYKLGLDQFCMLCTTFLVTLMSDLLVGVIAGMLLNLIIHTAKMRTLKE